MPDPNEAYPPDPMFVVFEGYHCQTCGAALLPVCHPDRSEHVRGLLLEQQESGSLRCTECYEAGR